MCPDLSLFWAMALHTAGEDHPLTRGAAISLSPARAPASHCTTFTLEMHAPSASTRAGHPSPSRRWQSRGLKRWAKQASLSVASVHGPCPLSEAIQKESSWHFRVDYHRINVATHRDSTHRRCPRLHNWVALIQLPQPLQTTFSKGQGFWQFKALPIGL